MKLNSNQMDWLISGTISLALVAITVVTVYLDFRAGAVTADAVELGHQFMWNSVFTIFAPGAMAVMVWMVYSVLRPLNNGEPS